MRNVELFSNGLWMGIGASLVGLIFYSWNIPTIEDYENYLKSQGYGNIIIRQTDWNTYKSGCVYNRRVIVSQKGKFYNIKVCKSILGGWKTIP